MILRLLFDALPSLPKALCSFLDGVGKNEPLCMAIMREHDLVVDHMIVQFCLHATGNHSRGSAAAGTIDPDEAETQ
jgi:hypothetical protein